MSQPITLRLPQDADTLATAVRRKAYSYRYAYSRSADSRAKGDSGQDYLILRDDEERIAFVLCDGVSQSFFGDLAARLLGDHLLDWLWNDFLPNSSPAETVSVLVEVLRRLTVPVSEAVQVLPLPLDLPALLRGVLEQKRQLGSESTFAAGVVDTRLGTVTLLWMGDTRVRVWGTSGQPFSDLEATFHTAERWSSVQGPVGQPHVMTALLKDVRCLALYSDGLATLDSLEPQTLNNAALDSLIVKVGNEPESDDICFLELWIRNNEQRRDDEG